MTSSFISYLLAYISVNCATARLLWSAYSGERVADEDLTGFFLLFGLISLLAQLPLGLLADKFRSNGRIPAALGCLVCALGILIPEGNHLILATSVTAAGTALFLAGGLTDALTQNRGYTRAGIFLACGTLGSALGVKLAKVSYFPDIYIILALIFCAGLIFTFCRHKRESFSLCPLPDKYRRTPALADNKIAAVAVSAFAVFIRSWAGVSAVHPESDSRFAWAFPFAALFAGIFLGGLVCDLFDPRFIGTLSAAGAALMFMLSPDRYLFYLAGLAACGVSVSLTLCNIAQRLPERTGLCGGIFSAAILCGEGLARLRPIEADSRMAKYALPAVMVAAAILVFLTTPGIARNKDNKTDKTLTNN